MSEESPCIGLCTLDNGVCVGCGRTIEEITQAGKDAARRRSEQAAPAAAERKDKWSN